MPAFLTLRRFNNFLTVVVIMLGMYIGVSPFLPAFQWWAQHEAPIVSSPPTVPVPKEKVLSENTLVIPALGMQELVHEGNSAITLRQGVWLRPHTSTPDKDSNTVLAGHRFTYRGQAVFYNLDKIKVGDAVQLHWQGKRYDYQVNKILVVPPTDTSIEGPTEEPRLTIYTCTPLWSAKNRLVIEAALKEAT